MDVYVTKAKDIAESDAPIKFIPSDLIISQEDVELETSQLLSNPCRCHYGGKCICSDLPKEKKSVKNSPSSTPIGSPKQKLSDAVIALTKFQSISNINDQLPLNLYTNNNQFNTIPLLQNQQRTQSVKHNQILSPFENQNQYLHQQSQSTMGNHQNQTQGALQHVHHHGFNQSQNPIGNGNQNGDHHSQTGSSSHHSSFTSPYSQTNVSPLPPVYSPSQSKPIYNSTPLNPIYRSTSKIIPSSNASCCSPKPQTNSCCDSNTSTCGSKPVSSCCQPTTSLPSSCCSPQVQSNSGVSSSCCGPKGSSDAKSSCCGPPTSIGNKSSCCAPPIVSESSQSSCCKPQPQSSCCGPSSSESNHMTNPQVQTSSCCQPPTSNNPTAGCCSSKTSRCGCDSLGGCGCQNGKELESKWPSTTQSTCCGPKPIPSIIATNPIPVSLFQAPSPTSSVGTSRCGCSSMMGDESLSCNCHAFSSRCGCAR
ncbi:hypothetical protein BC833DRAFT_151246 [Globomyces pollinis-pini]|nr:hypothetical protein BC833DRAFT_151246 [Globomyces pollinis-pini]